MGMGISFYKIINEKIDDCYEFEYEPQLGKIKTTNITNAYFDFYETERRLCRNSEKK